MSSQYTTAEVGKHKSEADGFWLIVETDVYDVTKFLEEHPGGAKILKRFSGKDATKAFWKYHNEGVLKKYGADLKIGTVGESAKL
ncbi:cytochrome b5-like heme/steroid binding domain-containing protein [Thelonectria olida]|uniref:Cytochrome b5-like heme/steroid binding domain-containing protein n=1 Tax=Thelonectria olida TaxID=1576542 RepID=A0A9P8WI53_9HYPO|nr:cytochrome b5-like heme/steroid binding domain-containing protein [Thelonectria olida]